MAPNERSLNLATAVCAGIYVALGDMAARGLVSFDAAGRLILAPRDAGAPSV